VLGLYTCHFKLYLSSLLSPISFFFQDPGLPFFLSGVFSLLTTDGHTFPSVSLEQLAVDRNGAPYKLSD
jgi:hypothetical protein